MEWSAKQMAEWLAAKEKNHVTSQGAALNVQNTVNRWNAPGCLKI